jgi:DNA-binding beta-propeller fold protein YncE
MRNRHYLIVPIVVAMLLVACDEPAAEAPTVTTEEPDAAETPALTLTVGEPTAVGSFPRLATDDAYVWATSGDANTIVRIDPAGHTLTGNLQSLDTPMAIAVLDGQVWVTGDSWLRIDRDAVDVADTMPAMAGPYDLAAGFGTLWAVSDPEDDIAPPSSGVPTVPIDPDIIRIDPQTKEIAARIPIEGVCTAPDEGQSPSVLQLEVSDEAVWALTFCDGDSGYVNVYRIDPTTNTSQLVAIVTGEDDHSIGAQAMAVVDGTAWLVTFDLESGGEIPSRVVRIDADSGTFEELGELGRWPRGIAYAHGFLWVTDCADATVTQVDPSTGNVVGDPTLVGTPAPENLEEAEEFSCLGEAVVHGSTLWVCALIDGTVIPVELSS